MPDSTLILAGAAVALLLLLLLVRRRGDSRPKPPPRALASSRGLATAPPPAPRSAAPEYVDTFRGGMLFPQPEACEAICRLRGRTFPEGKIPPIPVPGCDRGPCECQVHTVVGRRRGPRRTQSDRRDDIRIDEERRSGSDRRSGDPD
jgi:hypothetical protein